MALQKEAEEIRALIIQIMREAADAPQDVLARLYAAFPGREEMVRSVVNDFLASGRFDLPLLVGRLYYSALVPLVARAEHDPGQMQILACPSAVMRYALDFFGDHGINLRVDRDRLLNQLAHCVRTRSAAFQALYRQAKAAMTPHRVVISPSLVRNGSQVGVQVNGGRAEHVIAGTGGGTFRNVTAGATTNAISGPAIPTGGASGRVPQAIAEGGAEANAEESTSAEVLRLLRGLSVQVDDVNISLKRGQEKTDAQMEELNKRVRTAEENDAERGLELSRMQAMVNQNATQLNLLQGQFHGLTTLMGGMLGGAGVQGAIGAMGAMGGGGGRGPVGGILGYDGGGGGMFRAPSTSRLSRPLAVKSASAPSTPARRISARASSPATPPSTRATRSRSRASTGVTVDLTTDAEDEDEEEEGQREEEAEATAQIDEVDNGAEEKDAKVGGASETKGNK